MSGYTINAKMNVYNVGKLFCLMIESLYNIYIYIYVIICDSIYLKAIDLALNIGNWTYLWQDRVLYKRSTICLFKILT